MGEAISWVTTPLSTMATMVNDTDAPALIVAEPERVSVLPPETFTEGMSEVRISSDVNTSATPRVHALQLAAALKQYKRMATSGLDTYLVLSEKF